MTKPITAAEELLTRQGVRNLDNLGTRQKRGHEGRPRETHDQARCAHFWALSDSDEFDFVQVCTACGKVRR
jgi:hypothetical protein